MRVALLALAACGFPRPADVGASPIDAVSDDGGPSDAPAIQAGTSLTNFRVLQSVNVTLPHDLRVIQNGTHIDVYAFEPPSVLIPSFDTDGVGVTANSVAQKSGMTSVPLTGTVTYLVTGADGSTGVYTVTMHAGTWHRFTTPLDGSNTAVVGIAIGDLDGDNYPDVVVGDKTGYLYVYRNTSSSGTLGFARIAMLPTSFVAEAIAIADLDGDGRQDIAIGGYAGPSIGVYLNLGGNTFAPAMPFTAITQTTTMIASKLTSNGLPDLVTTTGLGNGVALLANQTTTAGQPRFATAKPYGNTATDQDTAAIAVLDWNDDQKPDLAIAAANGDIVRVLSGSAGYASADSIMLSKGSIPSWLAAGDLDGDGKPELAIATVGTKSILIAPHGKLSGIYNVATTGEPNCVAIADLDNDGNGDLVATSIETENTGYVETLINGSNRDFHAADLEQVSGSTYGCASVDVDHDGAPDILTVSSSAIRGSVLRR